MISIIAGHSVNDVFNRITYFIPATYALERIARDSARDHPTVMEVLSAYVREHAPLSMCPSTAPSAYPTTDVQAILTVIARRDKDRDRDALVLIDTCLPGTVLEDANLTHADLMVADLTFADLTYANLRDADLEDAQFDRANLTNANLTGAKLTNANLTNAKLTGTRGLR